MLILVGPSASGKTELAKYIMANFNMNKIVTYTTRAPRVNETNGIDYHFVSIDEFIKLKNDGYFVETTLYNNNYYGTAKKDVSNDKIAVLDPNGLQSFKSLNDKNIIAIFLNCKEKVRKERMELRKDDNELIIKRLMQDRISFDLSKIDNLDLVLDTSNKSVIELASIVIDFYNKEINHEDN